MAGGARVSELALTSPMFRFTPPKQKMGREVSEKRRIEVHGTFNLNQYQDNKDLEILEIIICLYFYFRSRLSNPRPPRGSFVDVEVEKD